MKRTYPEMETRLKKSLDSLHYELGGIRAGRASASVLDKVRVDYYGTPTPINQVAAVSTPEPRILQIAPWDPKVLRAIEKAIQQSDIGINPVSDGKTLRLTFPPLTEERRRDLAKQIRKLGEDTKVALRNIRRDELEGIKAQKKKSEITEDDAKNAEKDINEIIERYSKDVDKAVEAKEKEILEV